MDELEDVAHASGAGTSRSGRPRSPSAKVRDNLLPGRDERDLQEEMDDIEAAMADMVSEASDADSE